MNEHWLSAAAIVSQQSGPDWLGIVDNEPWSEGRGFYRGFSTSFGIFAGKDVWFHWPFQLEAGKRLTGIKLLWETEGDCRIGWVVIHHGGAERIELTGRMAEVTGEAVPFEPPEEWRKYHPPMARVLTSFDLIEPVDLQFGIQLCVMASGAGIIRFYGAAAVTA
jgi:hypothetical protein